MSHSASDDGSELAVAFQIQMESLIDEGTEIWECFDREVRQHQWHSFVPGDYRRVLHALLPLRAPGLRFLEWGSATGIITIMADLLGFEAYGIELDPGLVGVARDLARKYGSGARFATGSFLPAGYRWRSSSGDSRPGTIGRGPSAYPELGHPLEDFDVVYAYPWSGEEPMMRDLMRLYGRSGGRLLLHGTSGDAMIYVNGQPLS